MNHAPTRRDRCVPRTSCHAKVVSGLGCMAMVVATQSAIAQPSVQPPVFFGNETIVTVGRVSQRLADALRNVTVIRAEDIARSGQLTLAQVLQQFGGVLLSRLLIRQLFGGLRRAMFGRSAWRKIGARKSSSAIRQLM